MIRRAATSWRLLFCLSVAFAALAVASGGISAQSRTGGKPNGAGSYEDLVALFQEFLKWREPAAVDGVVDYATAAVDRRRAEMQRYQARLEDMGVSRWNRSQEVDYLAVRAVFDEQDFILNVTMPWSRDPVFYVEQMLQPAFVELPVEGAARQDLRTKLQAIPLLARQARQNLTGVAADYADLAIFYLTNSDGVGHGHPYRKVPPAGVIGWYEDLMARAKAQQPELASDVGPALAAVKEFHGWLTANRSRMTAPNGVGKPALDWFLRHAKMIPYNSDEIVTLAQRELERTWAYYTLERHRNRNVPELDLASSPEEYHRRLAATDARIRRFLVEEQFISLPEYIPTDWKEMGFNVPWINRGTPPNFWEQIQYRDPAPDHLHAVIPGHRFDTMIEQRNTHPIRGRISFGDRREGWGVYLEEAALIAGLFDDQPRVRELIYVFGLWRAARTLGDVWNQRNEMTAGETVKYWMRWTPWLDEHVSRKYAHLRASPGHTLHYTVGAVLMYKLLGERKHQLGEKFVLKDFHDDFMSRGRLPIALLRYEITGYDDDVRRFWERTRLSDLLGEGTSAARQ